MWKIQSVELNRQIATVGLDDGQQSSAKSDSATLLTPPPRCSDVYLVSVPFAVHLTCGDMFLLCHPCTVIYMSDLAVWPQSQRLLSRPTPLLRNRRCVCSVASWAAIQSHEQSCKFPSAALRGTSQSMRTLMALISDLLDGGHASPLPPSPQHRFCFHPPARPDACWSSHCVDMIWRASWSRRILLWPFF